MARVEMPCTHCKKPLLRYLCQTKGRPFCSIACRKAFHRPTLTCVGCKKPFTRNPKQPADQHCSWECFKASRHTTLTCKVCGKSFDSYLSEARKRVEREHVACCSRDCRNVYTSLLLGGEGTWVPGGQYNSKRQRGFRWRQVRAAYIAQLSRPVCEGCEGAPITQVHHLRPTAAGGDLYAFDNLMAVCDDCHTNMHEQLQEGAFGSLFEEFV